MSLHITAESLPTLRRRVAAGAGWSLAGRVTVAGLGLVVGVILTRLLPAEQMGTYLLASSLVAFGALVAGAGISQLCTRYVAEHHALGQADRVRRTLRVLLRLGLGCAAAAALVCAAITTAFGGTFFRGADMGVLGALLGAWVFLTAAQTFVADSFRGLSDIRSASLYGGPVASVLMVMGLVAVLANGWRITVTDVLGLVVAAATAAAGWAAISLRRRLRTLPPATSADDKRMAIRRVLAVSVPLVFTSGLVSVLASADLWVLGAARSAADVAAYGVASRTATLVGMPLLIMYGVLPPVIAGLYARGELARLERVLRVTATAISVPAVLLTVVFAVAGGPLLALVYGEHYRTGAFAFAVLSTGQLISVLTGVCGLVLVMTGHQRLLLITTAVSVTLTVAALVIVVPIWGTTGAALAAALGLGVQNVALLVAARRVTGLFTLAASPLALRSLRQVMP